MIMSNLIQNKEDKIWEMERKVYDYVIHYAIALRKQQIKLPINYTFFLLALSLPLYGCC